MPAGRRPWARPLPAQAHGATHAVPCRAHNLRKDRAKSPLRDGMRASLAHLRQRKIRWPKGKEQDIGTPRESAAPGTLAFWRHLESVPIVWAGDLQRGGGQYGHLGQDTFVR